MGDMIHIDYRRTLLLERLDEDRLLEHVVADQNEGTGEGAQHVGAKGKPEKSASTPRRPPPRQSSGGSATRRGRWAPSGLLAVGGEGGVHQHAAADRVQ